MPTTRTIAVLRSAVVRLALAALAGLPLGWKGADGGAFAAGPSFETQAREAFLIDFDTDRVLFEKNADQRMPPASMSKVMSTYIVFERIKAGRLSLDDTLAVSENAWRKGGAASGGSTMFLKPGERVRIEDLLRGVIVQSGNDASIVLAEGLAGTEEVFGQQMTELGRKLGLKDSQFRNATGLPDPDHYMTARDLALLAKRTIQDHPDFYRYYAELNFAYGGIRQTNRNPLLYKDLGVDGLKTGHTNEAGYGLAASAKRGGRRLILVVTGLPTRAVRSSEPERLFDWGFREFNNYALFKAGETVAEAETWLGTAARVPLVIEKDVVTTLPRKSRMGMKVAVSYRGPLPTPIAKGARLAKLVVSAPEVATIEIPLVAGADVERLGFFGRMKAAFTYTLWGETG